jgi:hypothetical protein
MALPTSVSLSSPVFIFMRNAYLEVLFGTDISVFSIGCHDWRAIPRSGANTVLVYFSRK